MDPAEKSFFSRSHTYKLMSKLHPTKLCFATQRKNKNTAARREITTAMTSGETLR